jgi:3-hydroxybutyryl-CoA dehydrogenase
MGRGIAIAFAYAGMAVDLIDFKPRPPADFRKLSHDAVAEMRAALEALAELGALSLGEDDRSAQDASVATILARIRVLPADQCSEDLAHAALIFEAVPETLACKREALQRLCEICSRDAIIASTTSTILVTDLVALVSHPERLLNAHWLNPAYLVPLVEISTHPGTSKACLGELKDLLERIGKVPMVCGPAPGFIVPRLQALMMNEAARMVEEGVATAEEIDKATRFGLGFRFASMGVVEFIDYGGVDILYHANHYLAQALSPQRYAMPALVTSLMKTNKLGLKSGAGFYDYGQRDVAEYRKDALKRSLGMLRHLGLHRPPVL